LSVGIWKRLDGVSDPRQLKHIYFNVPGKWIVTTLLKNSEWPTVLAIGHLLGILAKPAVPGSRH
jgi:hypothetical protein